RPLVALDEVEIRGRDAQPLGHRRLGQPLGEAHAADAGAREDLLLGHNDAFCMSGLQLRLMLMFYSFHKFTTGICAPQYKFTRIFGAEIAFSSLVFAPQCRSSHERGAGKGASDDERRRRSNCIMTDFYNLIPGAAEGRFDGIERPFTPADVERLRARKR